MVAIVQHTFRIVKDSKRPNDYVAEIYDGLELKGLLHAKTRQQARLAAIQYLKDYERM